MNKLLLILVVGIAGAGLYVLLNRRSEEDEPVRPSDPAGPLTPPSSPAFVPGKVERVVRQYFTSLERDVEEYEKSTLYSYQFDVWEWQRPYSRQIKAIASLTELGLTPAELQAGNAFLIDMAKMETGGSSMDWGSSLVFLMDLAASKAKIAALTALYGQIADKEEAGKQLARLRENQQNLVDSYR